MTNDDNGDEEKGKEDDDDDADLGERERLRKVGLSHWSVSSTGKRGTTGHLQTWWSSWSS